MSGRGNGHTAVVRWRGAPRKVIRDDIQCITRPAIRRLARRAGVIRISGFVYTDSRCATMFLANLIH
ncbi:Histone-fold [Phytophthora cactorum]|nr:Histone-fold [Phytophthora cactorum]